MDILLQYLNITKQKQAYIKVVDVPCNTIHQSLNPALEIGMADRALKLVGFMEQCYRANFLFVGIINAQYCNRVALSAFSYVDFCQLTCGPGEASGID